MSSTAPDTETTPLAGTKESTEKYGNGMSGEAEGSRAESPQASQANAEAQAHARAARAAREKYARLVAQQAGVPTRNPHNSMQESFSDMMAHGDRIAGTEAALAATKVVDQLRSSFPTIAGTHPVIKPVVEAGLPYLPVALFLRPEKRGDGVGAFIKDPRVWSGGLIAALAVAKHFKGRIQSVDDVKFTAAAAVDELAIGSLHRFHAEAFDEQGKVIPGAPIEFSSTNDNLLKIGKTDGIAEGVAQGSPSLKATCNGKVDVRRVRVK